jgi:exodeoxyribonuclease V gamma subunit
VGELLDVVDATMPTAQGRARDQIVVRHPLQPFDPRNFAPARSWSFDPVMLDGARALIGPRTGRGPFLADPLPEPDARVIELDDLVRFAQHPVRAFLRRRLGIDVRDFSEEVEDDLPVELDGLDRWGIGQRLLDARLAGVDAQTARRAEIARGTLPPGMLGLPVVQEIEPIVEGIVAQANALLPDGAPGSVDVRIPLADGRLVSGTVHGVGGDLLRTVTYSQVAPKHRITAWVLLVALSAAYPDRPFTAATVGRAGKSATTAIQIGPILTDPTASLLILVDLFDRGMREPLPLFCKTSEAYAAGRDPKSAWTSGFNVEREDVELEHQLVLGGIRTYSELLTEPARPDESWFAAEVSRFGQLAYRMWGPLLALERANDA